MNQMLNKHQGCRGTKMLRVVLVAAFGVSYVSAMNITAKHETPSVSCAGMTAGDWKFLSYNRLAAEINQSRVFKVTEDQVKAIMTSDVLKGFNCQINNPIGFEHVRPAGFTSKVEFPFDLRIGTVNIKSSDVLCREWLHNGIVIDTKGPATIMITAGCNDDVYNPVSLRIVDEIIRQIKVVVESYYPDVDVKKAQAAAYFKNRRLSYSHSDATNFYEPSRSYASISSGVDHSLATEVSTRGGKSLPSLDDMDAKSNGM